MPLRTCSYCDSTFSKVEHLKRHERSHTGEKPYQCRKCDKRFSRGDVLNRHLKGHYHHGAKNNSVPPDPTLKPLRPHRRQIQSPTARDATTPTSDQTASPTNSSQHPLPLAPNSPKGNETAAIVSDENFDIESLLQHVTPLSPRSQNGPARRGISPAATRDYEFTAPLNHPVGSGQATRQNDAELQDLMSLPYPMAAIPENAVCDDDNFNTPSGHENSNEVAASNEGQSEYISDNSVNQNSGVSLLSNRELDQFLASYGSRIWQGPDIGEPEWLSALDADLSMIGGDDAEHGGATYHRISLTGGSLGRKQRLPVGSEIPADRFARVARLWPKTGEKPWKLIDTLWADVLSHKGDHLFSEANASFPWLDDSSPSTAPPRQGLDNERRMSMTKEYGVTLGASAEQSRNDMRFPDTDVLEMCIDLYFHRFHTVMPLLHKPTFSPKRAPNTILFPICLIGLYLLNPARTRHFVSKQLLNAMEKCHATLSKHWPRTESITLLNDLGSAILLLYCAATMEECVDSKQTYALYTKALSVAQESSLFELDKGPSLASVLVQEYSDDSTWKAWSRVETTKRLITCLIMIDSFFAAKIGASPIIRGDTLQFHVPCSTALFTAPDANRWSQLGGDILSKKSQIIDFRHNQTILPEGLQSISFAIQTLLAAVWLRFIHLRHQLLLLPVDAPAVNTVVFPGELYQKDTSGAILIPLLGQIYALYRNELAQNNPNNLAFWHNMNIALTANMDLFEMAVGRNGLDAGKAALNNISIWSQSPYARRACLHAAQIYACMSRRKLADGTMFLSEVAIFNSALVLGLYIYVSPASLQQEDQHSENKSHPPIDLLDEVDWTKLGGQGLPGLSNTHQNSEECVASRFISEGGPISFAGVPYSGGYTSSRKIFLEYIGLLEDIGKWNVDKYCRILRIISDSVLDLESHQ